MKQAPSFQFYPREFMSSRSVVLMTPEARGGYVMLLCHAWLGAEPGVLEDDDLQLATLSGLGERWDANSVSIRRAFLATSREGRKVLIQRRMVEARAEQSAFHEAAAAGGRKTAAQMTTDQKIARAKKAAEARWDANRDANRMLSGMLTDANTASASASALEEDSKAPATPGVDNNETSQETATAFKRAVQGLATAKSLPAPRLRSVDPDELWARLGAEPETVQRTAMKLAGWLEKRAVAKNDVLACVDHYLAHQATVDNVFTYYAPRSDGFHFATTGRRLSQDQADHERQKQEERRWLSQH